MSTLVTDPGSELPKLLEQHIFRAWKIFRTHFTTLWPYYVLLSIPALLLIALQDKILPSGDSALEEFMLVLVNIIWSVGTAILQSLAVGMIIVYTAALALEKPLTPKESFSQALRLITPLVLASLAVGLLTGIGLALLIVPGLIVAVFLTFTAQAVLLDKKSAREALETSYELVKPQFWRIVGFLLVAALLTEAGVWVLERLADIFTAPLTGEGSDLGSFFATLLDGIINTLGTLYIHIFTTLFYLSSKRRYGAGSTDKPPVSIREAEPVETDSTSPGVKE